MKRAVQMTMPVIKQVVSVLVSLDGMAINVNKVSLETATHRMNICHSNYHQSVVIKIMYFFPWFMPTKGRNLVFAECECSREGVLCDKTTGACTCKAGWFGELCQGKLKLITLSQ